MTLLFLAAVAMAPPIDVRQTGARGDGRADDTAAIQKALDGGRRTVMIPAGTYLIRAALLLDSDTIVRADRRAVIRLADHAGTSLGIFLLKNRDEEHGNHDLTVEGGIWDGNGPNNPRGRIPPCYTGVALNFINVERLTLAHLVIRDPESFALRAWRLRHFRMEDIGFDYAGPHGKDGIHLNGYCEHGLLRDIHTLTRYATNDDMIALNADDATGVAPWTMCQGTVMGPIRDIRIEHVRAESTYTFVRLQSRDNPVEDITVSDVAGGCRACAINLNNWKFPRGSGTIQKILLRDFKVHKVADPAHPRTEQQPLIVIYAGARDFRIENFHRDPIPQPQVPTLVLANAPAASHGFTLISGGFSRFEIDPAGGVALRP